MTTLNPRASREAQLQDQLDELGNDLDAIDPFSLMGIIADHLDQSQYDTLISPLMRDILNFSQSRGVDGERGAIATIARMIELEQEISEL